MDISSKLVSFARKGMHLQVTMNNGLNFDGQIIEIDFDSILLQSKNKLAAASLSAVIAWQLDIDNVPEDSYLAVKEAEQKSNHFEADIFENEVLDDTPVILESFHPEKAEHRQIIPKSYVTKSPQQLLHVEKEVDRKKWDSILSRYQNALKNNNLDLIESLADELAEIGDSNPECGALYYNAGCFKLKSCNYPDAGELFDRAFRIDKNSDCAYNAAASYLLSGDREKALIYLGIYFCQEYLTQDENMWYRLCSICRDRKEKHVFCTVFNELINKYYQKQREEKTSLVLLIKSALYVLNDVKEIREKILANFDSIEDTDPEITNEKLEQLIDDLILIIDEKELCKGNNDFDFLYYFLNGSNTDYGKLGTLSLMKEAVTSGSEDYEDIPLRENCTASLKSGFVYRTIPPYRYGFLKDGKGVSYHFKYEVVFDNIGYVDSVTEDNPFPVFFKSKLSDVKDASTEETATFVCSYQLLDNMILLAQNFSRERDYPSAILELDKVLDYDPDHPKARELKDRWTKIYEDRYKSQTEKISIKPVNGSEWEAKGNLLLKLDMPVEAMDAFCRSSKSMPGSSALLYGQGVGYLKTHRYEEAVECLSKAIQKNSIYYHAIHTLGIVYNRLGKYKNSLECFEKVIKIRPDHMDAWRQKAFALFRLEKYEEAVDAYDMVMALDPEDWIELSKKSSALLKNDKLSEAMRCIDLVLQHIPEHPDSLFIKGYIYQVQNNYTEALHYINRSLDHNPKNVKALSKKAFILAVTGEKEEALQIIQDALGLNMSNHKTWYYKGVVHHYAEDYEAAIAAYKNSLDLSPGVKRVVICKQRAEQKLKPSIEAVPRMEKGEENKIAIHSEAEVTDLIADLNKKFSKL